MEINPKQRLPFKNFCMRPQSRPSYYIKSCFERTEIIKTYKLESHIYKKEGQTLKLLFSAHEI